MKRKIIFAAILALSVSTAFPSFAGTWKRGTGENTGKWWYDEENGTYAVNGWRWIDGNGDGIAECYCFDQNGWLYTSRLTPDQKTVNENGAWVQDGAVVTQNLNADNEDFSVAGTGTLDAKTYQGIDFSFDNLGVSSIAVGAIMYPKSNTVTAESILDKKKYYEIGTDNFWLTSSQKAAVDSFISDWKSRHINGSMSDEEKARAIYDWIVENVAYDLNAPNPQSSYGAFIDRRCVCGGYANAFRSLGKACGLDVKYLLTSNHSFNLVNLSGKWYTVDTTWKKYKTRDTTDVYYMHTTPEGYPSIEEKAAVRKERFANRSQEVAKDNEYNNEKAEKAFSNGEVYHADDENLIPAILDYLDNNIIGKQSSQKLPVVVYTGGRNFQAFNKFLYQYHGKEGRLDDVLEAEIRGRNVNGFTVGDTSSCTIRWQKNTGIDGSSVFVTTWKDENNQDYVVLDFNINPQR